MSDDFNGHPRTELLRIAVGRTYRQHHMREVYVEHERTVQDVELPGTYRVEGFALDCLTRRESVLYVGLDGADTGRLFHASRMHFAVHFRAMPTPGPAPSPEATAGPAGPPRAAGHVSESVHG